MNEKVLKQIQDVASKHTYIDKIVLFGSRARGDNHIRSDIDLLVYATEDITLFNEDIENTVETLLSFDITLFDNTLEPQFLSSVINEGSCIYDKISV